MQGRRKYALSNNSKTFWKRRPPRLFSAARRRKEKRGKERAFLLLPPPLDAIFDGGDAASVGKRRGSRVQVWRWGKKTIRRFWQSNSYIPRDRGEKRSDQDSEFVCKKWSPNSSPAAVQTKRRTRIFRKRGKKVSLESFLVCTYMLLLGAKNNFKKNLAFSFPASPVWKDKTRKEQRVTFPKKRKKTAFLLFPFLRRSAKKEREDPSPH